MRSNVEQELHDDFVNLVSSFLKQRGYNYIKSILSLQDLPPKISGHTPDVFAEKVKTIDGTPQILERLVVAVETSSSLRRKTTKLQHEIFEKWAKQNQATFKKVVAR